MRLFENRKSKFRSEQEQAILKQVENIIIKHGGKVVKFERNYKSFGDMILIIEDKEQLHEFLSDRGEIVYNKKSLFSNEYHIMGIDDAPTYLILAVKQIFDR